MKKTTVFVLALALILCINVFAEETIDVSQLTPEQIAEIQAQIDAMTAGAEEEPASALEILEAMIEWGAPIDPDKLTDYDETTDPNGLMGTKVGAYTSKTDFGCVGYAKDSSGDWVGGTIEVFDEESYAQSRFDYLESVYVSITLVQDSRMYVRGNAVLRTSLSLTEEESLALLEAFEAVVDGETVAFNGVETEEQADEEITSDDVEEATTDSANTENIHTVSEYTQLEKGDKGTSVAQMQMRLKNLGYLNDVADGIFGSNTQAAVIAFQEMNGLDATGIATPEDQVVLFSEGVISASGEVMGAYDPYEVSPAEISNVKLKSSYGTPYVTFTITNTAAETIQAITYEIRFYDAFGDRLVSSYENTYEKSYSAKLEAGASLSISTKDDYDMYDYDDAVTVAVAITRVMMADGTDITYSDPVWFEG